MRRPGARALMQESNAFIRHISLLRLCLPFAVTAALSTVGISHSSDYANVKGHNLRPGAATVKVSRTVSLSVKYCGLVPGVVADPNLAPLPRLECSDASGDAFAPKAKDWAVNGIPGGNRTVGTVSGSGWTATYKAPSAKPTPNTVVVSATIADKRGKKKILVSSITIKDQVTYTGTVQFSTEFTNGTKVSGSANVTWTEYKNPEDDAGSEWYLPSGTIVASVNSPHCDPLQITGPIATGSSQNRRGGGMTIFPSTHPGHPNQYYFALVGDRTRNINQHCGSPPNRQRKLVSISNFVAVNLANCGSGRAPYNGTAILEGKTESGAGGGCRISWKFAAQ